MGELSPSGFNAFLFLSSRVCLTVENKTTMQENMVLSPHSRQQCTGQVSRWPAQVMYDECGAICFQTIIVVNAAKLQWAPKVSRPSWTATLWPMSSPRKACVLSFQQYGHSSNSYKPRGKSFRPIVSAHSSHGLDKRSAPLRLWLPSFDIFLTSLAAYNAFRPSYQQPKNRCAKAMRERKQSRLDALKARILIIWWHHRQKYRTGASKSTSRRQWLVKEMTRVRRA